MSACVPVEDVCCGLVQLSAVLSLWVGAPDEAGVGGRGPTLRNMRRRT
jgi:hypothetical protein